MGLSHRDGRSSRAGATGSGTPGSRRGIDGIGVVTDLTCDLPQHHCRIDEA